MEAHTAHPLPLAIRPRIMDFERLNKAQEVIEKTLLQNHLQISHDRFTVPEILEILAKTCHVEASKHTDWHHTQWVKYGEAITALAMGIELGDFN